MWLIFALIAPLFFGIVHVMDSYCVEDIFERPWLGMVTSAFTSLVVYLALPFFLPLVTWYMPPWQIIAMALAAGALIQFSQFLYFQSLSYSEAGIIAAYWNMIPAILIVLSFVLFGHVLTPTQYFGIAILVAASTYMILLDHNFEYRLLSFFLMLIASFMQACAYLLLDATYEVIPYLQTFYIMITGLILTGFAPLLFAQAQKTFQRELPKLLPLVRFFVWIEVANLLALASAQKALSLGDPSIVASVETTIPAFTFMISLGLLYTAAHTYGDQQSRIRLPWKLCAVGMMCLGVWMVS